MSHGDDVLTLSTVEAVDVTLPIAGLGSRSFAFIIDWHIRLVAALACFMLLEELQILLAGAAGGRKGMVVAGLPAALIYLLYHPVLEVLMGGRTPGKRIAGIRVVTQEGHAPSVGAHLVRNLFRLLDSLPACYALGMAVMTFNRRQARLGDLAAGTLMVFDQPESAAGLETLANAQVAPKLALLAEELLRRWRELEPAQRQQLAQQLLQRAGRSPDLGSEEALRSAVQALLGAPAA